MKKSRRGKVVGWKDEIPHGTTKKFLLRCHGRAAECLLVGFEGKIFGYVNRCCHIPLPMDWVDNRFFTEDKQHLICANHGATYEPTTGECIWGPCFGASLKRVPLEVTQERIIAFCPED
ncbi:MAG: Rieske (2Fe-2S) protein [Candidatus Binatia bacterium]